MTSENKQIFSFIRKKATFKQRFANDRSYEKDYDQIKLCRGVHYNAISTSFENVTFLYQSTMAFLPLLKHWALYILTSGHTDHYQYQQPMGAILERPLEIAALLFVIFIISFVK